MKKEEILDIAKKLIVISVKYKTKISKKEKEEILNIFYDYEEKLKNDNTKYAKTVLWFLLDLKDDLNNNRKLNIDKISSDEYLENFLVTKNEVLIYNNLILEKSYRKIFDELIWTKNNKIIEEELKKIIDNFETKIKKLNLKIISKNLLIFVYLKEKNIGNYLKELYIFLNKINQKQEILKLIKKYKNINLEIKKYSIEYFKKWDFNYKILKLKKEALKFIDITKTWYKTWNPKYEYKKLIKKL